MKIGILTFHRAINFGAVLQCYALYRTLSDMGHDVEVIDYRPAYIEKYRKPFYWNDFKKQGLLRKLKTLLSTPLVYWKKRTSAKVFDTFINQNLKTTKVVKKVQDIPSFDIIFFGSDQIWSPRICEGIDPMYYGQLPKGKTKIVSYAASLGTPQVLSNEQWNKILPLIKSFDAISVRESKLAEYLQNYGIKAQTVLDPTLLASKELFEKIVEKPKETGYVLLYMLEQDSNAIRFANNIAKQKNLKLIRIRARSSARANHNNYKEIVPNSVGEFLGYFKYADYVVNVSFHGTAFSIIFNKNFYSLKGHNYERAYGLLNSLNLSDRFVLATDNVVVEDMDYAESNKRLEEMRKASCGYLYQTLNM